jgi:2-C-methyl-D-erythritol 4-phosphate cytidylyltransferase
VSEAPGTVEPFDRVREGTVGVVVVAAGSGSRLGSAAPKALVQMAGRSLLAHTLVGLRLAGLPPATVVYRPGHREAFVAATDGLTVADFVEGGSSRSESVRTGVAALPTTVDTVVVHDAARPLMPPGVIRATLDAVLDAPDVVAAAPALPVSDTLKRVDGQRVVATVDRSGLVGVQTPQTFPRWSLQAALQTADDATDDLGLVEELVAAGAITGRVVVVMGSAWGRKVTYPSDLAVVEALAEASKRFDAR